MTLNYSSIVFAGGGTRCLWQAGFYETISQELAVSEVAAVSAGAFFSCLVLSGRMEQSMDYFKEVTSENRKNVYLENLFNEKPVFPQYDMYRKGLFRLLDDAALRTLKDGPEIRILVARPPAWLGPRSATVTGLLAYSVEKKFSHPVHPVLPQKLGFRPEVLTVKACDTPDELADLILQSSCTPPFVPVMMRNGSPVLDGGLVDNVPVSALTNGGINTLVLLTRQYSDSSIPDIPGRTYVQPSEKITIDKWDYTDPEGILRVYGLGKKDGERFLEEMSA